MISFWIIVPEEWQGYRQGKHSSTKKNEAIGGIA